ncbi:hypothetical protein JXA02_13755 [candidate division KSB1 bacterium]|nr:hypothetical protein [candidate division KSB1 bacterium]
MSLVRKHPIAVVIPSLCITMLGMTVFAQEAKFQQSSGENGLVCMEAENYSIIRESATDTYWEFVEEPLDFAGTGAMQALPAGQEVHKVLENAQSDAPVLRYAVNFVRTDSLYVWGRSSHVDGYDDSVWFGLDELIDGTQPLSYTTAEQTYANEWYWISYLMDGTNRAVLHVPSTGVHMFEIYMREPSYRIDKIVLTTNPDYNPGESDPMGPAETLVDTEVQSVENGPQEFQLAQNYPNPFNPSTMIEFTLAHKTTVHLNVYNTLGYKIKTLLSETREAGRHSISWDATANDGSQIGAGIYYYSMQADGVHQVCKMLYIK